MLTLTWCGIAVVGKPFLNLMDQVTLKHLLVLVLLVQSAGEPPIMH